MPNDDDSKSLAAWAAEGVANESSQQPPPVAVSDPPVAEEPPVTLPAAATEDAPAATIDPDPGAEPEPVKPPAVGGGHKKPKGMEPWMKDRLAEQTAKQREAERQAQEAITRAQVLEAELEALRRRAASPDGNAPAAPITPSSDATKPPVGYVPAGEVDARAAQLSREESFNSQANAAYYAGKESYQDFDDALQPLSAMGAIQRRDFQEAALATDAAPDVIYHLGSNPNEASKILGMLKSGQTAKAAAEMTKIAVMLGTEKAAAKKTAAKSSNAPAPIRPVGGSALPAIDLERLSDDDFTAEFDKKAKAAGWY